MMSLSFLISRCIRISHEQWLAREIITRVQKLRKKADLQAIDDVKILLSGASTVDRTVLERMIRSQGDTLIRILRCTPVYDDQVVHGHVLISEDQEVSDLKFALRILKL